ncbi:hypothetical protein BDA96_01G236000 [Sorghum bicolor]|uniref:Uncharacterized protein n=1 Tax=Sorghum bicolor TaxID=4558 RepID=A0A921S079_SORBI|nr:hypothetical protein BDA96_01G236000 [Sorghum bicolor]
MAAPKISHHSCLFNKAIIKSHCLDQFIEAVQGMYDMYLTKRMRGI